VRGEDPAAPGTEKKGWSTGKKVAVDAAAVGGLTAATAFATLNLRRFCFHCSTSTSLAAFPSSRLFSADVVGAIIAPPSHFLMSFGFLHTINGSFAGVAVIGAACVAGALLAEGDGLEDLGDRASES